MKFIVRLLWFTQGIREFYITIKGFFFFVCALRILLKTVYIWFWLCIWFWVFALVFVRIFIYLFKVQIDLFTKFLCGHLLLILVISFIYAQDFFNLSLDFFLYILLLIMYIIYTFPWLITNQIILLLILTGTGTVSRWLLQIVYFTFTKNTK